MALNPGTRLGPYEVLAPIGAGGMGEVYRARDTRLDRTVAIKVLPSHVAADLGLRERFEREARAVAALNHPHICTLHDVGRQDDVDFLVMECLEGEPLADRLKKGAVPIPQALQYAVQIADGLDKAHRAGIVHRDLKPGNIFLTRSGGPSGPPIAKLLDFGLAKTAASGMRSSGAGIAVSGAVPLASAIARASMAPTEATPLTQDGTILGTLQYMAPEQLEGREADARTDIFAFGAVLYEMVTGARPFTGKSQVGLMAAILDQEPPPISTLQPVTPPLLEHLVKTCLAKNPDARWQHAGDVLIALKLIAEQGTAVGSGTPVAAPGKRARLAWITAAGLLVIAAGLGGALMLRPTGAPAASRVSFHIETATSPSPLQIAISPDGTRVVTLQTSEGSAPRLWVRALADLDGQFLQGTDTPQFPFWSPDGRAVGFFAGGKLNRVDLAGGPPQPLADAAAGIGGTWNSGGVIVFTPTATSPLFRVSAAGGVPTPATELDAAQGDISHRHPFFLPDGDHFLYTAISTKPGLSAIYVGSISSKERTKLVPSTVKAVYGSGHLLFMRDTTTVMAQRFDPGRLALSGDPFPVLNEEVGINLGNSAAGFAASANGVLVYRPGGVNERIVASFDATGRRLMDIGAAAPYESPAISPDSQRVAVFRREATAGDIWLFDSIRGTSSRFTFDAASDTAPMWSPDGSRIAFASNRAGAYDLYVKNAGGVEQEQVLLKSAHAKLADDWSRDGRFLLYRDLDPKTGWDVWALPLDGDRKPRPLVQTPFTEYQGHFSPDGRWFAYTSDESGAPEVYVQSFPPSGGKWQISTNGGVQARWRRDGRELYFHSAANDMMAVDVDADSAGGFKAGVPRRLFRVVPANRLTDRNSWDVTPDGQRFVVIATQAQAAVAAGQTTPLTVVMNWLAGRNP